MKRILILTAIGVALIVACAGKKQELVQQENAQVMLLDQSILMFM